MGASEGVPASGKAMTDALELIRHFEGCRLEAYQCPAGKWTIGYGHTGPEVKKGLKITLESAGELLAADAKIAVDAIQALVRAPLSDGQYSALISFVYNVGVRRFQKSTLVRYLNLRRYDLAAREFDKWVYGRNPVTGEHGKLPGLVKRRAQERRVFES